MKQRKETPKSSDLPIYLFKQGNNQEAYRYFGAHLCEENGEAGAVFRVWAPHAKAVSIVGDFNSWTPGEHPMEKVTDGIWERFVPGIKQFDVYKYCITTPADELVYKADPYAFHTETRPSNGSKVYDIEGYTWGDAVWVSDEEKRDVINSPMSIYEMQAGSWKMKDPENGVPYNYAELADELIPYIKEMGYTHVELLPITEYPFDGSWGYQVTGYFAPTSRYGTPKDFMAFVDKLHQAGIGVILDWVPAHFPRDAFGLYHFDGTPTYEYADPRKGEHPDWGTQVFDLGRNEVRSFLFSNAMFWLEEYHFDGLRVDAVSSMLYLDYGRQDGAWMPNIHGGKENLEAIEFFQKLNTAIFAAHPDVLMIAEESTAWPKVTHPVSDGGLGFNFKWNMGWMNDICHYIKLDPYFRQFNHRDITFSLMYAFSENYILPLSHDEVVHMKGSFLGKMPGDNPMKFAGVRVFYTYMLAHPGKKLTFMGAELAQWNEWHYEYSLDWHLLQYEPHRQTQEFFKAANAFYLEQPALWEQDDSWQGFQWLCADDNTANTVAFLRWDREGRPLVVVANFSPIHRKGYQVGLPFPGTWAPVFNTDAEEFGGAGLGDTAPIKSVDIPCHDQEQSMTIDLPPMSVMIYRCTRRAPVRKKKDSEKAGEKKTSGKVKKPEGAKDAGTAAKKTQAIKTVKKKDDQA